MGSYVSLSVLINFMVLVGPYWSLWVPMGPNWSL